MKKNVLLLSLIASLCVASGSFLITNAILGKSEAFAANFEANDVHYGHINFDEESEIIKKIEPNQKWFSGFTEHNNVIYLHTIDTAPHFSGIARICTEYHDSDGITFTKSTDSDEEFIFQDVVLLTVTISPESSGGPNGFTVWVDYDSSHCIEIPYDADDFQGQSMEFGVSLEDVSRLRITGSVEHPHQTSEITSVTITYNCSYQVE